MKQKTEVFETFKVFKALVDNSFGENIKSITSDNGGKYVKINFQHLCVS